MYSSKVTFVLRKRETSYKKSKSPFCRLDEEPFTFFMGLVAGGWGLVGLVGGRYANNDL